MYNQLQYVMLEHMIVIDWFIISCLTPSCKYFMHIQDENKFNNIKKELNRNDNFWLPLGKKWRAGEKSKKILKIPKG